MEDLREATQTTTVAVKSKVQLPTNPIDIARAFSTHKKVPFMHHVKRVLAELLNADDKIFIELLTAAYSEDAVEGSLSADDWAAAFYLRDYAIEAGDAAFTDPKATASKVKTSLKRALSEGGYARWQRRDKDQD